MFEQREPTWAEAIGFWVVVVTLMTLACMAVAGMGG